MVVRSIKKYNWKGKKVLIVEDDAAGSFLLSEILTHTQIEIQIVESWKEGVDICRMDSDINIVLLDMHTPGGMSGYDAAKKIRKMHKELPIIAQSAFVMTEDKDRAIESGCNAHISKPLNTFVLLGTMHRLLHNTDSLPI